MESGKMTGFYKDENCPASDDLVAFEEGELPPAKTLRIMDHLETCEFCAAEAELYSMYPLDHAPVELPEPAAIPAPLFELAEALLKKKQSDPASLKGLLIELDPAMAH
jgi:anti-sigma factor RsiW